MTYSVLLMWDRSSKIHYFIDFLVPFVLKTVEDRDVTFHSIFPPTIMLVYKTVY